MRIAVLQKTAIDLHKISAQLEGEGLRCHGYLKLGELMNALRSDNFDLAIVDLDFPAPQADELLAQLRSCVEKPPPILFTTAPSVEDATIELLIDGSNDYIPRPLRQTDLIARSQSLLRRAHPAAMSDCHDFGDYCFDSDRCHVEVTGIAQDILLTSKEFKLALLMFRNTDRPLSRGYIREAVWGRNVKLSSRTMDTHVSRIRNKLHLLGNSRFRIVPVYGYGYRLDDVREGASNPPLAEPLSRPLGRPS